VTDTATAGTAPPRAVVFDNDGLLLDTEPCYTRAQEALFAAYGQQFTLAAKQEIVGTSPATVAPILARLLPGTLSGEQLSADMYERALTEIAAHASPRPGAESLVARLRAARLPLAVASNAPRRHLIAGLRRTGLLSAFDVVLGVDDVARPKPAPDLYLAACAGLGVPPAAAIALEDSPPGVMSARSAGLRVIGIPSITGVALPADLLAESLADAAVLAALLGPV
jgi:HAD superfamily hydrolase (TIGR01509 family)